MITELNERSREIFRHIVDAYLTTGQAIGSRTISEQLAEKLSPASIRNVMADLEAEGLLFSPHVSAGRMPTQIGLRLYIDGLMEIGDLSEEERNHIDAQCQPIGQSVTQVLEKASTMLSGLSAGAGIVIAPKTNKPLQQIQFVQLGENRVLAVLVMQDGMVENRILDMEGDISAPSLVSAGNYLNEHLKGKTFAQARKKIANEIKNHRTQLDWITEQLVQKGLALEPQGDAGGHIIIRGQSRLLQDVTAIEDLEKARHLFAALEEQETMEKLLASTQDAEGIQIFIGAENRMFEHSGWSMIISPYKTEESRIIGAIGVIGPTCLNYGRIIPIVDYTSKIVARMVGS